MAIQDTQEKKEASLEDLSIGLAPSTKTMLNQFYFNGKEEEHSSMKPRAATADLDALGGNEEIINYVADVVRYLQDPQKYEQQGVKLPKGIMLSGPPGVGKTYLAEAVAGHADVPIIMINASDFNNKYVGGTEKKMRAVFEAARKAAPCVLCIDEIDSIATKRVAVNGAMDNFVNSVVNELLTLLAQDNPGVIIFGTTNNYETLDPAVVSPGRFDRHIRIPLPDLKGRAQILAIQTKDKKLTPKISLEFLSSLCSGFSGAKIAAWVNEAAMIAYRENADYLTMKHFDEARTIIEIGVRQKDINPIQKNRTASHEAAHALVGHLLKRQLYKISTNQYGQTRGFTVFLGDDTAINQTQQNLLDKICTSLAGRAAEQILGIVQVGSHHDLTEAKELAKMMVISEGMGSTLSGITKIQDIGQILQEQMQRAIHLIKENQQAWENVTNALIEHDELNYEEFLTILAGKELHKPNERWLWWGSEKKESKPSITLPPKKIASIPSPTTAGYFTKSSQQVVNLHLSLNINEVAKALEVPAKKIRKIQQGSSEGIDIVFKPSFNDFECLKKISNELKQHDVENRYSQYVDKHKLEIRAEGVEDFVKFVNKRNGKDNNPSCSP